MVSARMIVLDRRQRPQQPSQGKTMTMHDIRNASLPSVVLIRLAAHEDTVTREFERRHTTYLGVPRARDLFEPSYTTCLTRMVYATPEHSEHTEDVAFRA